MSQNTLVFLSTQLALGFEKPVMGPESLFVDLNASSQGSFGDTPTIVPVPFIGNDQRLLESPVVESVSPDNLYELKIARGRIDLFRNTPDDVENYDAVHDELLQKVKEIFSILESKASVEWMGFINNYILVTDLSAQSDKIFNQEILKINPGRPHSFSMRNANRFDICGTLSNNQISISTGSAQKGDQKEMEGLIIIQDFNTKPTPSKIDYKFVETYLNQAKGLIKIDEIIKLLS